MNESLLIIGKTEPVVRRGTTKYGPGGGCSASALAATGLPPDVRKSLSAVINHGLAQSTWSTYDTAERMWRKCEKETAKKLELPWTNTETLTFLNWLICVRKVSAATASSYLAGMRKIHTLRGLEEPQLRKGLVGQVLKGKKNMEAIGKRNNVNKGRLPVTLTMMKLIKEVLRTGNLPTERMLLTWAVCTLAFHGSFRIHEILARNETFFRP